MRNAAAGQENEGNGMESTLGALGRSIARWTDRGEQHTTAVAGLSLFRREEPTGPISGMYEPSVCLVAQGAKRVLLGNDAFVYDAQHYLITSVHLPTIVQIIAASREKPYLGLRLMLDPREISRLMVDSNLPPPRAQQSSRGMATGEVTLPLLTAFQRLVDLLGEQVDIPILAPIIQREIIYRLLESPDLAGDRLDEGELHAASADRRTRRAGAHEHLDIPPPLPVHDRPEPPAVPETAPPAGGQAPDAVGTDGCRDRSVPGRVREPFAVQP
jgi:hypothetical protein